MSDEIELITISRKDYDDLLDRERWLDCLEMAGVDNWDGIEEARAMYDGEEDE